jgi:hypothetical protein
MALDLSDDFDLFDNTEAVTYQRRNLAGEVVQTATVTGLHRALEGHLNILHSRGGLLGSSMGGAGTAEVMQQFAHWHLKAEGMEFAPRRGDRIVSVTRGTWEVATANSETFATRHLCFCRKVS